VVRILEIAGRDVDFTRLVDFAIAHNMTLALEDALRYVATLTDAVPEEALGRLAEAGTSILELEEYRVITSGRGLYGKNRGWTGRPIHGKRRSSLLHMQNVRHEAEQEPAKRPDLSRTLRGLHEWRSSRKP
jgi:hypothetical protein